MQHNWDKYFDTKSEYWEKAQKIYEENDNYPKIVVPGRNLHHKFLRSFSRLEGTEIDNDKENLVSLSEGDHFLVHYYLWKCTNTGYRNRTAMPVRFMYKKAAKYLTDEIAELIAKEWTCKGVYSCKHSEKTKRKISKSVKKVYEERGTEFISEATKAGMTEEVRKKISDSKRGKKSSWKGKHPTDDSRKKMSESHKGKHWKLVDGKRVWY